MCKSAGDSTGWTTRARGCRPSGRVTIGVGLSRFCGTGVHASSPTHPGRNPLGVPTASGVWRRCRGIASTVYLRCVEHDYRIIRRFQHRSSFQTFLTIVIERIYLDFRNRQWGKWRPSARAARQGPVAVLLERLLDRDGCALPEALALARARHGITLPDEALAALAADVRIRPRRQMTDDGVVLNMPDSQPRPDELVARTESARQTVLARRALAKALLALESADRELIALRFRAGLSVVGSRGHAGWTLCRSTVVSRSCSVGCGRPSRPTPLAAALARAALRDGWIDFDEPVWGETGSKVA